MKNMNLVGIAVLGIFVISSAYADDVTYTTRKTNGTAIATFTQVEFGKFGKAWKAPNGVIWSAYQGNATNEPIQSDQNLIVVDSPATELCAKIGGKLPSFQEYSLFSYYFETDLQGDFTEQGKKDMNFLFPDMQERNYWSLSITEPLDGETTEAFESSYDYVGSGVGEHGRFTSEGVRCVADGTPAVMHADLCKTGEVYKTSTGATFTCENDGKFGLGWRDPEGLIWGAYQGVYINSAIQPDQNGIVMDSQATEACSKIGGKLPTVEQYKKLVSHFDLTTQVKALTTQGKKDLYAMFPDMQGRYYWTGSLNFQLQLPSYLRGVYLFEGELVGVSNQDDNGTDGSLYIATELYTNPVLPGPAQHAVQCVTQ